MVIVCNKLHRRHSLFCYTNAMDLMPRNTKRIILAVRILLLLCILLIGYFVMYFYLWNVLTKAVKKTIAQEQYVEMSSVACTSDADCKASCTVGATGMCACLKNHCAAIPNNLFFATSKYCESDADCVLSCYEGPVSRGYYDAVGGEMQDCSEGCKLSDALKTDPSANDMVCKKNQCQFTNGHTCFINEIPKKTS